VDYNCELRVLLCQQFCFKIISNCVDHSCIYFTSVIYHRNNGGGLSSVKLSVNARAADKYCIYLDFRLSLWNEY
jgi:hypothetical protein